MKSRLLAASVVLTSFLTAGLTAYAAPNNSQLQVASGLKIPGATLPAGTYNVSLEDRLIDRAIVRVASTTGDAHFLLLAVPKAHEAVPSNHFAYFTAANNSQALRAWRCQGCSAPLEFVYPKAEAIALTGSSGKPVIAMDPAFDKMPENQNLSQDDMKVVTLWLVEPETVTADNKGQGVKASKWADHRQTEEADATQSSKKPGDAGTQVAEVRPPARHLPHTATNTFAYLAGGVGLLLCAFCLRMQSVLRG